VQVITSVSDPSQTSPDEFHARPVTSWRRPETIIVLVLAAIYIAGTYNRSFWSENEAYYSLGAESVLEGRQLLPVIHERAVADKPPFMFWWVALVSVPLGVVSEFTARLANVLPSIGTLALLAWFAKRVIGSTRTAVLSAIALATSHEFIEVTSEVNTDSMLLLSLVLSWMFLYRIMQFGFTWRRWCLLWIPMSIGLLTKGPVAPALSCLVAVTFAFWNYGWRAGWSRLFSLRPWTGALVCFLPFILWCMLIWRSYGFAPLETVLLRHNVQRFVSAFDHAKPWYYYFVQFPVVLLPWTLALPLVFRDLWVRRKSGRSLESWQKLSLCAIAVVFVFFSLSSSKRAYYLLPLVPWACLLIGHSLTALGERAQGRLKTFVAPRRLVHVFSATAVALLAIYVVIGYPLIDSRKSPLPLVEVVKRAVDHDDRLFLLDEEDPRLMYYLPDHLLYFDDTPSELSLFNKALSESAEVDLLVQRGELQLVKKLADRPLYVEGSARYKTSQFYVLTTEHKPHLPPFSEEFINLETAVRGKGK